MGEGKEGRKEETGKGKTRGEGRQKRKRHEEEKENRGIEEGWNAKAGAETGRKEREGGKEE